MNTSPYRHLILLLLCALFVGTWGAQSLFAADLTVNSTADDSDVTPGDGLCQTSLGDCTLRAAIEEANALSGTDSISFNIPGAGPHTIAPANPLPTISQPITIDGTTQPGASCAVWPPTLLIELTGSSLGVLASGLDFQVFGANGSVVRGLVINQFNTGIHLPYVSNAQIECNFIGTNVAGTAALGNTGGGIFMQQDAENNTIGGPSDSQRNLISGNGGSQIGLSSFSAGIGPSGNIIQNNYIGTDVTGMFSLDAGSAFAALQVSGSNDTQILDNLISGNTSYGIYLSGDTTRPSSNNIIQGNWIGVDSTGTGALGNGGPGYPYGISVISSQNDTIGGTGAGEGNIIAHSYSSGIGISTYNGATSQNIAIQRNRIFGNGGLGIDLGGDGATANDVDDVDTGDNNLQNFPILANANLVGNDLQLNLSLDSNPLHTAYPVIVDVYLADTEEEVGEFQPSSTNGQGDSHLANLQLTEPTTQPLEIINATLQGVSAGGYLVATATDANGNTSEFSPFWWKGQLPKQGLSTQ